MDCDWVIENVFLIDGSGNPGFPGKLAVKDDKIVASGGGFLVSETCGSDCRTWLYFGSRFYRCTYTY